MYFRQILHEDKSCLSYLIGCPNKGVVSVIDAQGDPNFYIKKARSAGLKIVAVIETHIQADHISASERFTEKTHAPLYFGPQAEVKFKCKRLNDGNVLKVGNRQLKIIHTPGHTAEHISILVDDWFVLTGDTLFVGDVGRVDLTSKDFSKEGLNKKALELYNSLKKLLKLPDWIEIYPGHYRGSVCGKGMDGKPISTIGHERRDNEALQLSKNEFIRYLTTNLPPSPKNFLAIKRKNLGIN